MPFDGIVTYAITEELKTDIQGGRINKIYQPTATELYLTIRNHRKNYTLLLSIHPSYARLHLTDNLVRNPAEPPTFCMHLRKHIGGAIIEHIEQDDLERIVSFTFHTFNEIGDRETKTLVMEIMGRHSNVLLLNDTQTKIINCLKHVPPFQNRYRSLLPGADYRKPPQQEKLNLLTADSKKFVQRLDFNAGRLDKQIVQNIAGISGVIGKEIAERVNLGAQAAYQNAYEALQQQVKDHAFEPAIYRKPKEDFHVLPMEHLTEKEVFPSANAMADAFYVNKAERDRVKQRVKDVSRIVKNELDKNIRKKAIHEKTLKKAAAKEDYQIQGELLTAHMHQVQKGDETVTVIDYYDPDQNERTISLKTDKTPSENAQLFFKQYRKLQAAEAKATAEIIKTDQEIAYLEDVLQQLDSARDEDVEEIRDELAEEGYVKQQKQRKKKKQKPQPDQYVSSDGTTIYVGRNNKQNEYVTQKLAHKNDIWLHTLDIPGSHVVIKHAEPSEATLEEAAILAAYYSKARQSASVPVDYTAIRYVKKPSGAKPGFVTYTDQKTLYVTPAEERIKALQKQG